MCHQVTYPQHKTAADSSWHPTRQPYSPARNRRHWLQPETFCASGASIMVDPVFTRVDGAHAFELPTYTVRIVSTKTGARGNVLRSDGKRPAMVCCIRSAT